jgi:hypothetical protein
MRCKKSDGSYVTVTWRLFYPRCSRILQGLGRCSALAGAYVPAITVCNESLF